MMSSMANRANGDDSTMPGNYESFSPQPPAARTRFPQLASDPSAAGPSARAPILPPMGEPMRPAPMVPRFRQRRPRHHRRRPLTPEIVIHRRSHGRSSWGRKNVITVPLDNRPTLGLRGAPTRVIEIERIPCRRRRRRKYSEEICYEFDDNGLVPPAIAAPPQLFVPQPPPPQPQIIIANPFPPPAQPALAVPINNTAAAATSAFLSNISQQTIDNLPRQMVHLPPIHIPGSHADANTELDTVVFPAEIMNPIDGTLSVIQGNPGANNGGTMNIQPAPVASIQPQLIQAPTTVGIPIAARIAQASPAMASDPVMQRFQELFQRLTLQQTQTVLPTIQQTQTVLPTISQAQTVLPTTTQSILPAPNPPVIRLASYPPITRPASNLPITRPASNLPIIRPASNPPIIRPASNLPMIHPAPNPSMIRPRLSTMAQFDPTNNTVNNPPTVSSLNTANLRSYPSSNIQRTNPLNIGSSSSTNNEPFGSFSNMSYRAENHVPAGSAVTNMSYRPANITPYRPSTFTPSSRPNNSIPRLYDTAPSNSSDIGPYQPANITPYTSILHPSSNNSLPQSSSSPGSNVYASAPLATSSNPLTPFPSLSNIPSGPGSNYLNSSSNSSLPLASIFNQSTSSTPKSILRNNSSMEAPDNGYTNLNNSPIATSSKDAFRKTARFI